VEKRKQEDHFNPNAKARKGKLPLFLAYYFVFLCVFLSFLLLEKKKMPKRKRLKQKGKNRRPKVRAKSERAK